MNEKYALFIWTSYGISVAVLLWNWLSPRLARGSLRQRIAVAQDGESES